MDMDLCLALLTGKDNKAAYALTRQIVEESRRSQLWYPHLDQFSPLLEHKNSLVRNRAIAILAANARWDTQGKLSLLLPRLLAHITDEKPIAALEGADLSPYPDSMRPLILKDIVAALQTIQGGERP